MALKALANAQGLSAVILDALNTDSNILNNSIPGQMKLGWIGEVLQGERMYAHQQIVAADMAKSFHNDAIKTYVLKGCVIAECYPNPNHRPSVDVDCYLLPIEGNFDAWKLGNDIIQAKGFSVNTDFYKNSSFEISGVNFENHQYFTPFRGNERLKKLEIFLQSQLKANASLTEDIDNAKNSRIGGSYLYRPPVMVSALFLIEHAYSHFLHEGLTWRMVLDWMMFSRKHQEEIDWKELDARIDEFGFRKFYESFYRLGKYLVGEMAVEELTEKDKRMLADIWDDLDLHETVRGLRGKLALAGNTWRARWKYRYFSEDSMLKALWIQVKGVMFDKNPQLN